MQRIAAIFSISIQTQSIEENCRVHVKKPATLLNVHYFTDIFQGISPSLNQCIVAVYLGSFIFQLSHTWKLDVPCSNGLLKNYYKAKILVYFYLLFKLCILSEICHIKSEISSYLQNLNDITNFHVTYC